MTGKELYENTIISKLKEENSHLKEENAAMYAENKEIKNVLRDVQERYAAMQISIEKKAATEHGCIVINGIKSAAYQDLVGILLASGYAVELTPLDHNEKLKVTIKESEV